MTADPTSNDRAESEGASLGSDRPARQPQILSLLVTAAAVILIIIGLGWFGPPNRREPGSQPLSQEPPATTAASARSAPVVAPASDTTQPPNREGASSRPPVGPAGDEFVFVVDTDFGLWRWQQVVGDRTTQPLIPDAFIDGRFVAVEAGLLWASIDGLDWISRSLPPEFEDRQVDLVSSVGHDYAWTHDGNGSLNLYRHEAGSWKTVPLPTTALPHLPGLVWDVRARPPVKIGSTTVINFAAWAEVPWADIYKKLGILSDSGIQAAPQLQFADDPMTLELVDEHGELIATLDLSIVRESHPTVELRDRASGELIHMVVATYPEVARTALIDPRSVYNGVAYTATWVSTQGRSFMEVAVPWQGRSDFVALVTIGDEFLVNADVEAYDDSGDPQELWISLDALNWSRVVPSLEVVEPPSITSAYLDGVLEGGGERVWLDGWTSTDGRNWVVADAQTRGATPIGTECGFPLPGDEVAGMEPRLYFVQTPPLSLNDPGSEPVWAVLGCRAFVAESDGSSRTMWVGRLDG